MKKLILNILFVIACLQLSAQNLPNPYASIGKKAPKVATASNGEFEEFFIEDTLVQIGTTVMNRYTGEVVFLEEGNSEKFKAFQKHNEKNFRFLSVDALSGSYPWYTPYQFAGNKPIWAIDLDGLEEYVYTYLFKGKDKPAQLISKDYNIKKNADGTLTNIKTGQQFDNSQMGTVQYQYEEASGKGLEIKKDYEGNYTEGEGDIMDMHQDGMFGTIYTGRDNPLQSNGEKDYRREAISNLDYASLKHDKNYDKLKTDNPDINFATDKAALPADKQYISDLKNIVRNKVGETGAKNTTKERIQAGVQIVKMFFYTSPKKIPGNDGKKK
jgi:hypothetical protein